MGTFIHPEDTDTTTSRSIARVDLGAEAPKGVRALLEESMTVWLDDSLGRPSRFIIAEEGFVVDIADIGDLYVVELEPHAGYKFVRSNTSMEIIETLREALVSGLGCVIAAEEDGMILDVHIHEKADALLYEQDTERAISSPAEEMPVETAAEIFRNIVINSTTADNSERGSVPYLFPDDGCWGRAHAMYRIISNSGESCRKIWTYRSLSVATGNNPRCRVGWRYHVAVAVEVSSQGTLVFDPSLFDSAVDVDTWLRLQRGRMSDTRFTAGDVFFRSRNGKLSFDRNFQRSDRVVNRYRLKLLDRVERNGWPPFSHCHV